MHYETGSPCYNGFSIFHGSSSKFHSISHWNFLKCPYTIDWNCPDWFTLVLFLNPLCSYLASTVLQGAIYPAVLFIISGLGGRHHGRGAQPRAIANSAGLWDAQSARTAPACAAGSLAISYRLIAIQPPPAACIFVFLHSFQVEDKTLILNLRDSKIELMIVKPLSHGELNLAGTTKIDFLSPHLASRLPHSTGSACKRGCLSDQR